MNDKAKEENKRDYITFDLSLKALAKLDPKKLFKLLTNHFVKSVLPTEYQNLELRLDYVVELDNDDILHIEFQSINDPQMHIRMLNYFAVLKREFEDRNIIQIVLYIGDEKMNMKDTVTNYNMSYSFKLIDIRDLPKEELINSDSIADLIFAFLTRIDQDEALQLFDRVLDMLSTMPSHDVENYKVLLTNILRRRKFIKVLWNKFKEDNRMKFVFTREEILDDPLYEEGKLEGIRELLKLSIKARFNSIPEDISSKLDSINSLEVIESISEPIFKANSLDDVRKILSDKI